MVKAAALVLAVSMASAVVSKKVKTDKLKTGPGPNICKVRADHMPPKIRKQFADLQASKCKK